MRDRAYADEMPDAVVPTIEDLRRKVAAELLKLAQQSDDPLLKDSFERIAADYIRRADQLHGPTEEEPRVIGGYGLSEELDGPAKTCPRRG